MQHNPDAFDPSTDLPENLDAEVAEQQAYLATLSEKEQKQLMARFRATELAEETQRFIGSAVGQEMMQRARDIIDDCARDMIQADLSDTKALVDLQVRARAGQMFLSFLNEIIQDGEQAYKELVATQVQ